MSEHKCSLGILHHTDYSEIVTEDELRKSIEDTQEYNKHLEQDPIFRKEADSLRAKVYEMKDYADGRKSTNLTRFKFCPYCGKKIDWKKLR